MIFVGLVFVFVRNAPSSRRLFVRSALKNWKVSCSGVEHRQLVEKLGHIDQPKVYPAKENVLPFKGGRRMKAAEWKLGKLK